MRYAVRLLAAVLLSGVGLLPAAGAADAAVCSDSTGVTVVVDFHQLGGGVQTVCDPDGAGKTAASLFVGNGFPLEYVQRQPGFVCRVSGKPADDPCVNTPPANAYWGLFWSKGDTGTWSYSSSGAGSLKVPAGGSVAFSWQGSGSRTEPGVAPPKNTSGSSPTSKPTSRPGSGPGSGAGSGGGSENGSGGSASGGATTGATGPTGGPDGTATGSPTRDAHGKAGRHDRKTAHDGTKKRDGRAGHGSAGGDLPAETPTTESTVAASSRTPEAAADGGLPGWVPLSAIGVLFVTAVGIGAVQRRST